MMSIGRQVMLLVILAALLGNASFTAAQSTAASSDTLRQYVAQLQSNPNDQELREKIIALALSTNPPPDIPEDAQRFLVRGNVAMRNAKTPQDVQDSVAEFQKATTVAP